MVEINLDRFAEEVVGISLKLDNYTIGFFSYYNPLNKELNTNLFDYIQTNFENHLIIGDLNAKNEIFNSKITNKNGNQILVNTNSQIMNETFEPTFHILETMAETMKNSWMFL